MLQLLAFKDDVLAADITDSATSMTLTTGAFGTPTGQQYLVIDYDIAAKREIIKCTIDGTAVTSVTRAQDGTSAVAHSSGAKVIMAMIPSHYNYIANATTDGWIDALETWTYASATTITVPAGAASKYSVGDKIKLTQTTAKYFYVTAVADTVLTVTGGTDYTVANAAITFPYYSKASSPVGFPGWFSWTPTFSGSVSLTFTVATLHHSKFSIDNRKLFIELDATGTTGGTASDSVLFTPPVTPAQANGAYSGRIFDGTTKGAVVFQNNTTATIQIRAYDSANWGLGTGRRVTVNGFYEI
jgi:hypothetical protein